MKVCPLDEVAGGILGNDCGTVMVEYAVLLSFVTVGLCLSMTALGVPLVTMYLTQQTWLLLPFP